jgi:hypothetical protein
MGHRVSSNGRAESTRPFLDLSKSLLIGILIRRMQTLKYNIMDDELYRRTMDGLLLKCLAEFQARVAMGEVHDGLCGTHQSTYKIKWMLN